MFKPAAGSWECTGCYTRNSQRNQYCVSCDTPKDPSMPPKPKASGGFLINSQAPDVKGTFSFGIPQQVSFLSSNIWIAGKVALGCCVFALDRMKLYTEDRKKLISYLWLFEKTR